VTDPRLIVESDTPRQRFLIELENTAPQSEHTPEARLQRLIRTCAKGWGFRCLRCRDVSKADREGGNSK
jgi:hypothetical protein